jgi:hypothetical protein
MDTAELLVVKSRVTLLSLWHYEGSAPNLFVRLEGALWLTQMYRRQQDTCRPTLVSDKHETYFSVITVVYQHPYLIQICTFY